MEYLRYLQLLPNQDTGLMALSSIETNPTLEPHSKGTAMNLPCALHSTLQNPLRMNVSSAIVRLKSMPNKLPTDNMARKINFLKCKIVLLIRGNQVTYKFLYN
jgi:hypothetical protein